MDLSRWLLVQQAGRSSSLATGETTVTTCFRNTWAGSIQPHIYLSSNLSQDGEVDAALVSSDLGAGAARGEHLEHLLHSASASTSSSLLPTSHLTSATTSASKLFSFQFPPHPENNLSGRPGKACSRGQRIFCGSSGKRGEGSGVWRPGR